MTDLELNESVARKLGWRLDSTGHWHSPPVDGHGSCWDALPPYSTDIKAAWEIVGCLEIDYWVALRRKPIDGSKHEWSCVIGKEPESVEEAIADTAPRAICLAFLKLP